MFTPDFGHRPGVAVALLSLLLSGVSLRAALPTGLDANGQLRAEAPAASSPAAAEAAGFSFVRLENGVQLRVGAVTKNVLFYGPAIVRVNANLGATHARHPSLAVVARPAAVEFTVEETPATLALVAAKLRVVADKRTGALRFLDSRGAEISRERGDAPATFKPVTISGAPTYEVTHAFTPAPDESLYGLGQYNQPYTDYRGQEVLLVQTNIGIVVPFLVSTKRYGILWDIYSKMIFKDGAAGATLWAESAPAGLDYYFVAGDTMDGVIAGYRDLTGAAPMLPRAAFGLFMSKERYQTQARLLEVVRNFRREGFPLDFIVQDWQYWGGADGTWSGMIWDRERFPDPAGMAKTLHDELHVKLMNSIWPSIGNDTALARDLDAKGLRFEPLHWISKRARIYDAFSAEGRAIYFDHIKRGLLDVGVDALWMDGTEVEVGGACHDAAEVEADIKRLGANALGDFTRYLNAYTLVTTRGTYEGQRATGNRRVFTLTRSAWAGQQRYAAVSWSGDTTASWETLAAQVSGGLNVALAGQPYWTQDTGGFFVNFPNGEKNPEYRELFARWNQFGVFNPLYRIHGTSIEREPYLFKTLDPETYRSLLGAAQLRYRLLPYLYSLGWKSTHDGYTLMRALPLDFPDDRAARKLGEFMFGPALLVHPITRAMYHVGQPPAETIPTAALRTPDGRPGLRAEYFEGTNFETPAGEVVDAVVDHKWPAPPLANPPAKLTRLDDFSGRWTGTITAPEDGGHEIGVAGDDGYRLWLDGKLVVEDWNRGPTRYKSANLALRAGQAVAVRLDFFQGKYDRALRLAWRTPSQARALAAAAPKLNNTMETYLPAGAEWFDFWTNERHAGGSTVRKNCPLDVLPLYVRAGSIVPLGPVVQHVNEKPDAPYEIRIYPGADATFTLYEDDGETYDYEQGRRATWELKWEDAARTLSVGAREGSFPGLVATRELRIVVAAPGRGVGPEESATVDRTVTYTGAPLTVTLRAL